MEHLREITSASTFFINSHITNLYYYSEVRPKTYIELLLILSEINTKEKLGLPIQQNYDYYITVDGTPILGEASFQTILEQYENKELHFTICPIKFALN